MKNVNKMMKKFVTRAVLFAFQWIVSFLNTLHILQLRVTFIRDCRLLLLL